MMEIQALADSVRGQMRNVKPGSLRIWGDWFGKPYDNMHELKQCDVDSDCLKLVFQDDEVLRVWTPEGLEVNPSTFRIQTASRVRWEWYYYGRPKTPSNLYFLDYVNSREEIVASTNVDWYKPVFLPKASAPAIELS